MNLRPLIRFQHKSFFYLPFITFFKFMWMYKLMWQWWRSLFLNIHKLESYNYWEKPIENIELLKMLNEVIIFVALYNFREIYRDCHVIWNTLSLWCWNLFKSSCLSVTKWCPAECLFYCYWRLFYFNFIWVTLQNKNWIPRNFTCLKRAYSIKCY